MSQAKDNSAKILEGYRNLVLRWNRQINLISRQDTARRLGTLIGQCRDAWDLLVAGDTSGLIDASGLWYFDLGSGGGLPGIVWHAQMVAADLPVRTLLVEPREKRAWFLARAARLGGPEPILVAADRWGELPEEMVVPMTPGAAPSHILISLKALRLPDRAVLEGLEPFLGMADGPQTALTIARFYPPDQKWNQSLAKELEIPEAGNIFPSGSIRFQPQGGRVLSAATPRGACLVLSEYLISAS